MSNQTITAQSRRSANDDQHDTPAIDEHVFLTGRPPMGEFLTFVTAQTVGGNVEQLSDLSNRWRIANDHIRELEKHEAGLADGASISQLPQELNELSANVLADPIFCRSFQIVPSEIAMVELDRLVVFQKHINLEYVARLQRSLGSQPSAEDIFRCCLPVDHPQPPVRAMQVAQNAFMFSSPSNDLRFSEATLLSRDQIAGYAPQGPVSGVVGLVVGFGSNFLNTIHAEDRLVLNNGSHRAFALRDLGVTHVPCIVQHVSRRDELEVIASGDLLSKADYFLKGARPPLLKDYFDSALRSLLNVPRKQRQVKVAFGVEIIDAPAA